MLTCSDSGGHSSSETERGFPHAPVMITTAGAPAAAAALASATRRFPVVEVVGVSNSATSPRRATTINVHTSTSRAPRPAVPATPIEEVVHTETYARIERRLADVRPPAPACKWRRY
jgi:hypothetical protein